MYRESPADAHELNHHSSRIDNRPMDEARVKQLEFALYRLSHPGATWAMFEEAWPVIREQRRKVDSTGNGTK